MFPSLEMLPSIESDRSEFILICLRDKHKFHFCLIFLSFEVRIFMRRNVALVSLDIEEKKNRGKITNLFESTKFVSKFIKLSENLDFSKNLEGLFSTQKSGLLVDSFIACLQWVRILRGLVNQQLS